VRAARSLLVCALAALGLFAGVAWAVARWQGGLRAALDPVDAGRAWTTALHDQDELEFRHQALWQCMQGKTEVTEALLDGRLSLPEAADKFRQLEQELNEADPGRRQDIADGLTVGDDDASVYRNVLQWALQAPTGPPERAARLDAIRAEVDAVLRRPPKGLSISSPLKET
jgi:hypothetical protein